MCARLLLSQIICNSIVAFYTFYTLPLLKIFETLYQNYVGCTYIDNIYSKYFSLKILSLEEIISITYLNNRAWHEPYSRPFSMNRFDSNSKLIESRLILFNVDIKMCEMNE